MTVTRSALVVTEVGHYFHVEGPQAEQVAGHRLLTIDEHVYGPRGFNSVQRQARSIFEPGIGRPTVGFWPMVVHLAESDGIDVQVCRARDRTWPVLGTLWPSKLLGTSPVIHSWPTLSPIPTGHAVSSAMTDKVEWTVRNRSSPVF